MPFSTGPHRSPSLNISPPDTSKACFYHPCNSPISLFRTPCLTPLSLKSCVKRPRHHHLKKYSHQTKFRSYLKSKACFLKPTFPVRLLLLTTSQQSYRKRPPKHRRYLFKACFLRPSLPARLLLLTTSQQPDRKRQPSNRCYLYKACIPTMSQLRLHLLPLNQNRFSLLEIHP